MLQKRRYFVSILYFPKGCRSVMFKRRTGEIHKLGACSYGLPLRCISVCLCPSPSLSHTHTHTHTACSSRTHSPCLGQQIVSSLRFRSWFRRLVPFAPRFTPANTNNTPLIRTRLHGQVALSRLLYEYVEAVT